MVPLITQINNTPRHFSRFPKDVNGLIILSRRQRDALSIRAILFTENQKRRIRTSNPLFIDRGEKRKKNGS